MWVCFLLSVTVDRTTTDKLNHKNKSLGTKGDPQTIGPLTNIETGYFFGGRVKCFGVRKQNCLRSENYRGKHVGQILVG